MTYREAMTTFRRGPLAAHIAAERGGPDYPGRREVFAAWLDGLRRARLITDKQFREWLPPRECKAPRRVNGVTR